MICFVYHHYLNTDTKQIKFGATYMTMNNTFYKAVNNEIENVVNNHGDVLYTRDPALDPKKQNEQIKDLVSLGIDVLIINPVESSSINKTLKEVKKAGIKIIVIDAPISDDQIADCTVVSDNYDAGVQCAKDMMQRFDHARIALLEHSKALSAVDRINGFKDTVALNENYQIVGSEDCLGQTELALPALNKIIQQGIDFDVVFCLNDPTALGALASIKENDLGHDVFIYGVDGSPNIKKLLAETKAIVGTSSQSPTSLGKETIKVAYKMLHHKKYKRSIIVPTKLITKENIEEYDINGVAIMNHLTKEYVTKLKVFNYCLLMRLLLSIMLLYFYFLPNIFQCYYYARDFLNKVSYITRTPQNIFFESIFLFIILVLLMKLREKDNLKMANGLVYIEIILSFLLIIRLNGSYNGIYSLFLLIYFII